MKVIGHTIAVLGTLFVAQGLYSQTPAILTVDNPSSEGGRLRIVNSSKTGATISDWSIWNMTNAYGNGLSFWRYYANGGSAGPAVWFGDDGNVGIGTVTPGERLQIGGNMLLVNGEAASIFPSGHNLFFGGRPDYAHVTYTFRPSWGTPSETWASLMVQKADTSGNFTTTVLVSSAGPSYINGGSLGIGTTPRRNAAQAPRENRRTDAAPDRTREEVAPV